MLREGGGAGNEIGLWVRGAGILRAYKRHFWGRVWICCGCLTPSLVAFGHFFFTGKARGGGGLQEGVYCLIGCFGFNGPLRQYFRIVTNVVRTCGPTHSLVF